MKNIKWRWVAFALVVVYCGISILLPSQQVFIYLNALYKIEREHPKIPSIVKHLLLKWEIKGIKYCRRYLPECTNISSTPGISNREIIEESKLVASTIIWLVYCSEKKCDTTLEEVLKQTTKKVNSKKI